MREEQTNTKLRIEASSVGGARGPPSASDGRSKPAAQPPETSLSRRIRLLLAPVRQRIQSHPVNPDIKMAEEEVDIDLADPEVKPFN